LAVGLVVVAAVLGGLVVVLAVLVVLVVGKTHEKTPKKTRDNREKPLWWPEAPARSPPAGWVVCWGEDQTREGAGGVREGPGGQGRGPRLDQRAWGTEGRGLCTRKDRPPSAERPPQAAETGRNRLLLPWLLLLLPWQDHLVVVAVGLVVVAAVLVGLVVVLAVLVVLVVGKTHEKTPKKTRDNREKPLWWPEAPTRSPPAGWVVCWGADQTREGAGGVREGPGGQGRGPRLDQRAWGTEGRGLYTRKYRPPSAEKTTTGSRNGQKPPAVALAAAAAALAGPPGGGGCWAGGGGCCAGGAGGGVGGVGGVGGGEDTRKNTKEDEGQSGEAPVVA
jgi:hypothetical protein